MNRARAFELRCQRMTYRQIAAELGVCVRTAHQYVEAFWAEIAAATEEKAEMLRQMELETLDAMEGRWFPLAVHPALEVVFGEEGEGGKTKVALPAYEAGLRAVDRVIRIQERRAKLLGLDKPVRLEHSGEVNHRHLTLDEFDQRCAEAGV